MSEWILGWAAKMKPEYGRLLAAVKTSDICGVIQTQTPDEKKPAAYLSMKVGDGRYLDGDLQDFLCAYYAARRVAPITGTRSATLTRICLDFNRQELVGKLEER